MIPFGTDYEDAPWVDRDGQPITVDGAAPRLWRATDLKAAAQPRWLAKDRLQRAAVNLLIGDEGIGKSLLWVLIIAHVTTGKPLPGFGIPAREPENVILAALTEDDWQTVVRPRLEVGGVNLDLVQVICTEDDGSGAPQFPRDLNLIRDTNPALIIVDAWLDTLPASLSVKDAQQARLALHPWKELATVTNAAVWLLCHTNRVNTPSARDKYGATSELRKKARMTIFAQESEDGNLLLAGPEKANNAKPVAATQFTIEAVPHFPPTDDHDGTVPRLVYTGQSELTARQQIAETYATGHDSGDDAVAWLAACLAQGPRWAAELYDAAAKAGHSDDKAKRAKRRLHVESKRDSQAGAWFWLLPQHQGRTPDPMSCSLAPLLPCSETENQERLSTSQESKRANGEIQTDPRALGTSGAQGRIDDLYSHELCSECGKYRARLDTALCEWCAAKVRRRTPNANDGVIS
ncbi:MAG: AAA family ATPase [Mycobacterium sp.]